MHFLFSYVFLPLFHLVLGTKQAFYTDNEFQDSL